MSVLVEFCDAFEVRRSAYPQRPQDREIRLRLRLIKEETREVEAELLALLAAEDPREIQVILGLLLKELADLRYVTEQCAVVMGLDIDGAFAEVHRSNMTKLGADGLPIRDGGGKVLKGPGYEPADMERFVPLVIDEEEIP